MDFKTELPADLWGESEPGQKDSTSALKAEAVAGKTFSLTGAVDVSTIKQQMTAIEGRFPNAKPADIKLTGTASTFTATLTLPAGVVAPKDLAAGQATATGLGDLFEVKSASVNGQEVTVTFGLKKAYTSYEELKAAVGATGTQAAFRMAGTSPIADQITLEIPGFSLDGNTVKNGDELTVTGVVTGTFTSVANTTSDNAVRFNISWNGTQIAAGKDFRAKDDTTIQQTILVKKPLEASLPADMLVYVQPANATEEQQKQVGLDTTKNAPAGVQQGDKINLTGTIDAKTVKTQMAAIEAQFGNPSDLSSIKLSDLSSAFTATFTVPDGLTLPANLSKDTVIPTGFADTFSVSEVSPAADGKSVTVTFALRDGITDYKQLHDAVNLLADTMKLTVPGITVNEDVADGATLTTVGTVAGTFDAVATSAAGTEKDFSFIWTGAQIEDGKDKPASDLSTIQLTLATPNPMDLDLPSDILSGVNTEHEEAYPVFAGTSIDLTGAVKIDGIKQQMEAIENQFGNPDGSTIAVDIKGFGFTATMTLPEGMSLPEGLDKAKVTTTDPITGEDTLKNTFEVTDVKAEGQKVTITFGLKDAASLDTYAKLKAAVDAAGVSDGTWLKVTVPGVTVNDDVQAGQQLVVRGTVDGRFKAIATSASGTAKAFSFAWTGEQWAEGKDAVAGGDASIRFTAVIPQSIAQELPGDMLTGSDTTHDSTPEVAVGSSIDLTGLVKIDTIKQQMAAIEGRFGNPDGSSIKVDVKNFGFTATMTVPEGMTLPADLTKEDVAKAAEGLGDTFEITGVKVEGQKVTITFGLKDAAKLDTYAKLKAAVDAAGVNGGTELKVTVPGIKIASDLDAGTVLTSTGTVTGEFGAVATSASGRREVFVFDWTAKQLADGKDALATDDDTIQLSVKIASSTVTVKYVDEDGKEIADSVTLTGAVGAAYKAEKKTIDGYEFKEMQTGSASESGTFAKDAQTVVYVYKKTPVKAADVTVRYVDEDGREIAESVTLTGNVGDAYKAEQKAIDGYEFKQMLEGSAPAEGTLSAEAKTVTFVYARKAEPVKTGKVIVKYVDEQGNEIAESVTLTGNVGDSYTTAAKDIDGYELKTTPANATGAYTEADQTVTYVYAKKSEPVKTGRVIVRYVDEQGNEIAESVTLTGNVGDAYKAEQKAIDGYGFKRLLEGSAPAEGAFTEADQTVTLVYAKRSEPGKPGEPTEPTEPQKPGKGGGKKGTSKGKVLPKTGDAVGTYMAALAAAGVTLMAGAFALRRRKQEDAQ